MFDNGCFLFIALFQFHLLLLWQGAVASNRNHADHYSKCPFHPSNLKAAFQSPINIFRNALIPSKKCGNSKLIRADDFKSLVFPLKLDDRLHVSPLPTVESVQTAQSDKKAKRQHQSSKPLEVHVIGLSHHNAKVDVREKLAVPEAQWNEVSSKICELNGVQECAILSTCNRFEVYFGAHDSHQAFSDVVQFLCERSGLSQQQLRKNLFMLKGEDAAWHLLRVAGGLDSLVVGEGQILSQVRQCFLHGMEEDGKAGQVTARLLNTAVAAGKRVRAETSISRGAVSISSAAVEFCDMRSSAVIDKPFLESTICIIGAGKMSRLLATHMASLGVKKAVLVNRSLEKAKAFVEEHPDIKFEIKGLDELWDAVKISDVIYTSTAATESIFTEQNLRDHRDKDSAKLMLVDISVPRNVDRECNNLEGVSAFNVDDLKQVVARNTAMRRKQVLEAEDLLREELANFLGWQQSLDSIPAITQLQKKAEEMRAVELKRVESKLSDLDKKQIEAVEKLSKGIVNKLLHGPMTQLRAQEAPAKKKATLETVKAMFSLNEL